MYKISVILDAKEDVIRTILVDNSVNLETLHLTIAKSFGFNGLEMASFYRSDNEWNQGEEISLFDVSEGGSDIQLMSQTLINTVVSESSTKLLYIYDFLSLWTFMVELGEIVEEAQGTDYPNLLYVHGQVPGEAPEKVFEAEGNEDSFDEFEEGYGSDDYGHLDNNDLWN